MGVKVQSLLLSLSLAAGTVHKVFYPPLHLVQQEEVGLDTIHP